MTRTYELAVLASMTLLAACTASIKIGSEPQGARLSIDGTPVGVTPYTVEVDVFRTEPLRLKWELEGYETAVYALSQQPTGETVSTTTQFQVAQANVNTYGTSRPSPFGGANYSTNTYGTASNYSTGVTSTTPVYAWPSYVTMPLTKKATAPAPAQQPVVPAQPAGAPATTAPQAPVAPATATADPPGRFAAAADERPAAEATSSHGAKRFCTSCGALLTAPDARFCGSCGSKQ